MDMVDIHKMKFKLYTYYRIYGRLINYRVMLVSCVMVLLLVTPAYIMAQTGNASSSSSYYSDFWVVRLSLNLLGYAVIFLPGYFVLQWVRKTNYFDRAVGGGYLANMMRSCFKGADAEKPTLEEGGSTSTDAKPEDNMTVKCVKLLTCGSGLMVSYLTWGMIQERIMAFEYGETADSPGERFKNSQFLVFVNRILAFAVAMFVVVLKAQPRHTAPLYKYSYSSFSNIMSSWFQYEALKFVSFPTQVLAKASKVIPVMLMGKVVSQKTYEYYEYVTAVMISIGVFTFVITSPDSLNKGSTVTTFSGIVCLVGYLLFDSFTSNWQGELFRTYKVSSFQMMAGVNLFSVLLTSTTLLEQGGFIESMAFMGRHSEFIMHVLVLSLCSAVGQVIIFYTIQEFGAVTFTIIMTLRQGFAILLSCIYYQHTVTVVGIFGVSLVFIAIFIRIYCNQRIKRLKAAKAAAAVVAATSPPGKV